MSVEIYGTDKCSWCDRAREVCEQYNLEYAYKSLDDRWEGEQFKVELKERKPDVKTVPQIWWNNNYIGGFEDLVREIENVREYGQGAF